MEFMIVLLVLVVVGVFIVYAGNAKGAPIPSEMTVDALVLRHRSEQAWISRYRGLPFRNQQGAKILKQYHDKKIYVMELQLELGRRGIGEGGEEPDDFMIKCTEKAIGHMKAGRNEQEAFDLALLPVVDRHNQLISDGLSEEEANKIARSEYVGGVIG